MSDLLIDISRRKDYLWNTLAGVLNAAEVIVLSMVVTRFGRLSDAGILSLAFAVSNVLMAIGAFGGRMYHASDVKKQFTYRMYLIHRLFSTGLMAIVLLLFLCVSGYGPEKIYSVVIISFIYMIEVIENCIWGHYQLYNLLYVGARMFCTRWIAIISLFTAFMIISGDMITSLIAGAIAGVVVFLFWIIILFKTDSHQKVDNETEPNWFRDMTKQTFPLFLAGFSSLFINNIPKFAIDRYMNDEVQACYGFVAMPVFVIGLLNQFIYQPIVSQMARDFGDEEFGLFKHNVNKQMLEVAGISAICVVGAGAIGIPVLSVIYNTDLGGYWKELVILQIAGGFLALAGYFNVILTIMRKQGIILTGYILSVIMGIGILTFAVKHAGTVGASVGYLIVMAVLFIFFFLGYLRELSQYIYREA